MCKSKNPPILAPLIILEQSLKYKSCRVLKMVPNLFFPEVHNNGKKN
jgi:hypothetical protein